MSNPMTSTGDTTRRRVRTACATNPDHPKYRPRFPGEGCPVCWRAVYTTEAAPYNAAAWKGTHPLNPYPPAVTAARPLIARLLRRLAA